MVAHNRYQIRRDKWQLQGMSSCGRKSRPLRYCGGVLRAQPPQCVKSTIQLTRSMLHVSFMAPLSEGSIIQHEPSSFPPFLVEESSAIPRTRHSPKLSNPELSVSVPGTQFGSFVNFGPIWLAGDQ